MAMGRARRAEDGRPLVHNFARLGARGGRRGWDRPTARWEDPILRYAKAAGFDWKKCARDRDDWGAREEGFASMSW